MFVNLKAIEHWPISMSVSKNAISIGNVHFCYDSHIQKKRRKLKKGLDAAHVILKWKVSGQRPFSIARDVSKV